MVNMWKVFRWKGARITQTSSGEVDLAFVFQEIVIFFQFCPPLFPSVAFSPLFLLYVCWSGLARQFLMELSNHFEALQEFKQTCGQHLALFSTEQHST